MATEANRVELTPAGAEHKERVDEFLARRLGVSKNRAQGLCSAARVLSSRLGRPLKKGDLVPKAGLIVLPQAPPPEGAQFPPVNIIAKEQDLLVLEKPAGLPVLPRNSRASTDDCVARRLAEQLPTQQDLKENDWGLLHRLDNDTSGLLMVARNRKAYLKYRGLWAEEVFKGYLCLVAGCLEQPVHNHHPISHHGKQASRMTLAGWDEPSRGKPQPASTFFYPVCSQTVPTGVTLVAAVLQGGGVRHQIRVHAAELGFPLLGDELYGGPKVAEFRGQALHAALVDAASIGEYVCFPPDNWQTSMENMGFSSSCLREAIEKLSSLARN